MAGLAPLDAVKTGLIDLVDLIKLNALMDARDAAEDAAAKATDTR